MRCTPRKLLCLFSSIALTVLIIVNIREKTYLSSTRFNEPMRRNTSNLPFVQVFKRVFASYAIEDRRNGNMGYASIRIPLLSQRGIGINCRFPSGVESDSSLYKMAENHDAAIGVLYANCQFPLNESESVSESVIDSIQVREESSSDWITLPIKYRIESENNNQYANQYGICVPTLFGSIYTAKYLLEFMEFNRLLGVDVVTMYTDLALVSTDVNRTLQYYVEQGMLDLINFRLPFPDGHVWYHGQLFTIADCLTRHSGKTKYVVFHDLDEYLIPVDQERTVDTLNQLFVKDLASLKVSAQYMLLKDRAPLVMSRNVLKSGSLELYRTKCVVRPEMVFEQGIHHTSRVIEDHFTCEKADPAQLVLLHYTKKRRLGITDETIKKKYEERLRTRFDHVVHKINL